MRRPENREELVRKLEQAKNALKHYDWCSTQPIGSHAKYEVWNSSRKRDYYLEEVQKAEMALKIWDDWEHARETLMDYSFCPQNLRESKFNFTREYYLEKYQTAEKALENYFSK